MTKIQCVKDFECEVCHRRGMLQILGNYGRVRHYVGLDSVSKKPRFEYHKQSLEYVKGLLSKNNPIDLIGQDNIDLKLFNNSSFKCEGWDSNPRRPSPEDLKSSPLS